jgi:glycosyltransferase involved in cell wall biosynthesis
VRVVQYGPGLAAHGIDLHARPFLTEEAYRVVRSAPHWVDRLGGFLGGAVDAHQLLRSVREYDVVWIQRGLAPFLDAWALDAILDSGVPLVYDFDDAIYLPQNGGRAWVERLRDPRGVTRGFCVAAAVVLAGNEHLAAFARDAMGRGGKRVQVVPSVVDTDVLTPPRDRSPGPPVVGWVGSDSTLVYLEGIAEALAELSASGACRIVVAAGSRRPSLPGATYTFVPWSAAGEAELFQSLDVGLYPLDDSPWSRGKCGFKALQYMACAVPCIASPVGVLRTMVLEGGTGLIADAPSSWAPSVGTLLDDPERRRRMGQAGRHMVEERYSLRALTPVVAEALRHAAGGSTS